MVSREGDKPGMIGWDHHFTTSWPHRLIGRCFVAAISKREDIEKLAEEADVTNIPERSHEMQQREMRNI